MNLGRAWVYAPAGEDPFGQELCRRLRSAGGSVHEFSGPGEEMPGILLFTEVTPSLCELLEGLTDVGRGFVLAVATGPIGLKSVMRGDGWKLLKAGAADVLAGEDPAATAGEIVARLIRWTEIDALLNQQFVRERCAGHGRLWRALLRRVIEAAVHGLVPILLIGESGTGKEVIAGLVHEFDRRPDKRALVTVDCTTINRDLSGSELFGHVRGAFTGAHTDREGACALADKGTLFLDEVGELPLPLQAELLRVVQERKFKAIGSNVWRTTEFRLIAATHRDLERDVAAGRFRHDLYHRLAGWSLALPALRDRPEDIPALAEFFLAQLASAATIPALRPEVTEFLVHHPFPGNVRQLRNMILRAMLRYPGTGPITLGLIAPEDRPQEPDNGRPNWCREMEMAAEHAVACGVSLKEIGRLAGECAVRLAVRRESGNLQRAARRLGVTDRALQLRVAARRGRSDLLNGGESH